MKKITAVILVVCMLTLSLTSCRSVGRYAATFNTPAVFDFEGAAQTISQTSGLEVTAAFLETFGVDAAQMLLDEVENGTYTELSWKKATGYSYHVVSDMLDGTIDSQYIRDFGFNGRDTFDVSFAGDINFDADYRIMYHAAEMGGVMNCFDPALVEYLNARDVFMINNEFSIGTSGAPLVGKTFTFQVPPSSIEYLQNLGTDIVSLANNHVYDYGESCFIETLDNLTSAGIPYVGAGRNLDEASQAQYFIVNGCKVGIIAASRAEKVYFTPVAEEDSAGIMGTYDSELFVEAIKEADAQCDILVAYVHWGTENSTVLETAQKEMAREYIDAGADAIIGSHTHCLQGMEFYNGKPIIYSTGNFWFNSKLLDSCVITLRVDNDMNFETIILPLKQENCETRILTEYEDYRGLFDRVESYEPQGVTISDDGVISPAPPQNAY